jgi:excisionase family DNA binding protein
MTANEHGTEHRQVKAGESREWLGLKELTEYAALSERTIRAWIHAPVDPLPAVQVAKKILIRRRDFDAWLERHRLEPASKLDLGGIVDEVVQEVSRSARK